MKLTWDRAKAVFNRQKHGVDFDEATTVFGDPLAGTFPDFDRSIGKSRLITVGVSCAGRLCWSLTLKVWMKSASSASDQLILASANNINPEELEDDLRSE